MTEHEGKLNQLLERLKQKDPMFNERVEFGKFLMRHIDDLTPAERARYDELNELLKQHPI